MARLGGRALRFLSVLAVFVACSGRSTSHDSDSRSRSGSGGASGAQSTGGSPGDACIPGETQACVGPGRCPGAQACLPDGDGWEACDCGSGGFGGSSGLGGRAGSGGVPDAGAAGRPDPFGMCPVSPLPFGTTCSLDAACAELDCGSATSLHDRNGCLRKQCRSSDECAAGERCLPAPVALDIRDCWPSGCESCDESDGVCACTCYDDCVERAVCVPSADFPTAEDCPTGDMTCAGLHGVLAGVEAYLEPNVDEPFTGDALTALESCHEALIADEPRACDFCETWNGDDLSEPSTPAAAVAMWTSSTCSNRTVGLARGCDLTVVFLIGRVNRFGDSETYYVYDQADHLVGRYQLGPGDGRSCDRETMRTGKQIACFDAISDWCDPTVRQLFFPEQGISCPSLESCKVCGSGNLPQCTDLP